MGVADFGVVKFVKDPHRMKAQFPMWVNDAGL